MFCMLLLLQHSPAVSTEFPTQLPLLWCNPVVCILHISLQLLSFVRWCLTFMPLAFVRLYEPWECSTMLEFYCQTYHCCNIDIQASSHMQLPSAITLGSPP